MPKVQKITKQDGSDYGYGFVCPGCEGYHVVTTTERNSLNAIWQFNDDIENPTFSPSLLVRDEKGTYVCHSFIREGKIQFLSDCTHKLAGQTVPLKEIED